MRRGLPAMAAPNSFDESYYLILALQAFASLNDGSTRRLPTGFAQWVRERPEAAIGGGDDDPDGS